MLKARFIGQLVGIIAGVLIGIYQDGGEPGPTGHLRASIGRTEGADCRPGFVIASGKLGETYDPHAKYWNVGGVTIMIAPNQIPGDAQLRRFDGSIVEIIVREVRP